MTHVIVLLMQENVSSALERLGLTGRLPPELIARFRPVGFEPGEALIRSGDIVTGLLVLIEGRVQVTLDAENGRRLLLCFYEAPRLLGDMEILEPGDVPATSNVEALSACRCLALPKRTVETSLAADPALLREIARSLAGKLRRAITNAALNQLYPLEARAASYMLAASARLADGRLVLAANLSRVAELLGASFRHLHRTMGSLAADGLIRKEARGYLVMDEAELRRRAGSAYIGA